MGPFSTKRANLRQRSAGSLFTTRRRLDWPGGRDFRILALDGGGIRGILPLAYMAELERRYLGGASIAPFFDLITGTSTGVIIALGLASGRTVQEILDIYLLRGQEVSRARIGYAPPCTRLGKTYTLLTQWVSNVNAARCGGYEIPRGIPNEIQKGCPCDSRRGAGYYFNFWIVRGH